MDNKDRPTWSGPPQRHDFRPAQNNRRDRTVVTILSTLVALILAGLMWYLDG